MVSRQRPARVASPLSFTDWADHHHSLTDTVTAVDTVVAVAEVVVSESKSRHPTY